MEVEEIAAILEAVLFSSDRPVTVAELSEILDGANREVIDKAADTLARIYGDTGRSFQLERVAGGYQLVTEPRFAQWVRRFLKIRHAERLSRAALETLAIIAYRQPVTRIEVEAVRGVNVEGVLQGLLERRLVRIMGRKPVVGRPLLYGTTREFLEYFGLESLSSLPRVEELAEKLAQREGMVKEEPVQVSPATDEKTEPAPGQV